jgi:glycyl-tRNA synthetase beta chain
MTTLLVELLTEELPPKALRALGTAFADQLLAQLVRQQFKDTSDAAGAMHWYATPRRLAVSITGVAARSPDQTVREKVLPVSVAMTADGTASAPLQKKLAAMGLSHLGLADLERGPDGKGEAFFVQRLIEGRDLAAGLQEALTHAIAKLPIPKVMNYQVHRGTSAEQNVQFVRPAHKLIALHGEQIVPVSALGLASGRETLGHRFMSSGKVVIHHADDYARALHEEGKVIASYEERREAIREALLRAAGQDSVIMPDALLDEVNALVEWPVVYEGRFEAQFLSVPQECLILTMQQNQKYFALTDASGKMLNRFLLVSNLATSDASAITGGNERVLRARLSDARFFFDQDRKKSLESRLPGLASVVYHNKLGSQLERSARVEHLARQIAQLCGSDVELAGRAARLSKADLLTDMVGEFPELQGRMGQYYASHDGENAEVAQAIEEHYRPRFAGDALPATAAGTCAALADKLETLTGMFGTGNMPSGDKDPFALRRHALGILRILIEKRLSLALPDLVQAGFQTLSSVPAVKPAPAELLEFLYDRLRGLLREQGYSTAEVEAVVCLAPARVDLVPAQLAAVRAFAALPEAASLAAANKRISNILKKAEAGAAPFTRALLVEAAEQALADRLEAITPQAEQCYQRGDYSAMLLALAGLREPVDAFFNDVMVMAEDLAVRANRIALLQALHSLMNRVADLSRLAA